jgi:hypothetical protein
MLANNVTTAAIITSVMAIATSISTNVNAPRLLSGNVDNSAVSPRGHTRAPGSRFGRVPGRGFAVCRVGRGVPAVGWAPPTID